MTAQDVAVAALVLAAGRSQRSGTENKLLVELWGQALVNHVVDAALQSRAEPILVVTGHDSVRVRGALAGRPVRFVDNPEYASGLSTSLRAGVASLPPSVTGALVCLSDMPLLRARHLDALIDAFTRVDGKQVCVPYHAGRRGNPVLWPRRRFAALGALTGDRGARDLLALEASPRAVAMEDDAVLVDADTPAALAALRARVLR